MHHFVVPPESIDGTSVVFPPGAARQIARVLRLRDGATLVALDGRGAQYLVRLAVTPGTVRGTIVGSADACREPPVRVTLLAAPPKGERWEWLLQKCTEVGVARFVPIVTRYTQPGAAAIRPRHHEIVREAVEQCRRLLVPEIAAPCPFAEALRASALTPDALTVLLWEGATEVRLVDAVRPALARGVTAVHLAIGPEGGFHPDEAALARELGVPLAGLGPLILRAETAALAAAALVLNAREQEDGGLKPAASSEMTCSPA